MPQLEDALAVGHADSSCPLALIQPGRLIICMHYPADSQPPTGLHDLCFAFLQPLFNHELRKSRV